MGRREISFPTIIFGIGFTVCFASININKEKQQNILNGYVLYLNSLPSQLYKYEAIEILKIEKLENLNNTHHQNMYNVEMKIKGTDIHNLNIARHLLCFATVSAGDTTQVVVKSSQCNYVSDEPQSGSKQARHNNMYADYTPMGVENGIEVTTEITGVLCEDCPGRTNLRTANVSDLASIALQHLDKHDPYTKHYFNDVIDVDHQIIDSSTYILNLNVTYDNCLTVPSQFCKNVKICRVLIIENTDTDNPDGILYRNVVKTNCTRNTDLSYDDIDSRITDIRVPLDETYNILTKLYFNDDNINNVQALERSPKEPHVKHLARKSLTKYLLSVKNIQPHEVFKIDDYVTTQVSSGLMTKMAFTASPSGTQYLKYRLHCQSSVWEQLWFSEEHINVTCQTVHPNSRYRRSVLIKGNVHSDDKEKVMAKKLLKKYLTDHKIKVKYQVAKIIGYVEIIYPTYTLKSVDFEAIPEKIKPKSSLACNAIIRDHRRGENASNVSCFEIEEPSLPVEDDPSAQRFQDLMDASLRHYLKSHKIKQKYTVSDRLIATEQLLELEETSFLVTVDFRATPKISQHSQLLCHSIILGEDMLKKKYEINATCIKLGKKKGDVVYENPDNPSFKPLAQKSLKQYLKSNSIEQPYHVTNLIIVTKQVTNSETITNIDFRAHAKSNLIITHLLCHSKIKTLKSRQTININCNLVETSITFKNSLLADTKTKPSEGNDYQALAQESLDKYIHTHHFVQNYLVSKIVKVDEKKNKISRHVTMDFRGSPVKKKANDLLCHSNIVIYFSSKKTIVDVTCQNIGHNDAFVSPVVDEDPDKSRFTRLASEALKAYLKNKHVKEKFVVAERLIATSVLAITYKEPLVTLGFRAAPTEKNIIKGLLCRAEIVNTTILFAGTHCIVLGKGSKAVVYEDRDKPLFKKLAFESLKVYLETKKIGRDGYVAKVLIVTTQILGTSKTTIIYFRAIFKDKPKPFTTIDPHLLCYSVIVEGQGKKNIEVICTYVIYDNTKDSISLREFVPIGGEVVNDPHESTYKRLAELSLRNCKNIKDIHQYYVSKMLKVTEQIVSGIIIRIEFIATSVEGVVPARLHCKSKIWEQSWLKKLDFDVICNIE